MRARVLLVIGLGLTLAGCSTAISGISPSVCEVWRPIYISRSDKLTPDTERQLAENNAANEARCGYRPPPKQPQRIASR